MTAIGRGSLSLFIALIMLLPQAGWAAEQQAAFLNSYVGAYRGDGQLVGNTTETMACRLDVTASGPQRLRYTGQCVIAGERLPLRGTISYSDREERYEASATGFGSVVAAERGNGIVFALGRDYRRSGRTGSFQATFALSGGAITLQLQVSDNAEGGYTARVPLSR
jgi:hypothetical protein